MAGDRPASAVLGGLLDHGTTVRPVDDPAGEHDRRAADAGAQQLPPVRPLGAVVAVSKDGLGAASAARQLPNGKVLVNDINERKLMLFDADLSAFTVIADSTAATGNACARTLLKAGASAVDLLVFAVVAKS